MPSGGSPSPTPSLGNADAGRSFDLPRDGGVTLVLGAHCIQTTARHAYETLVADVHEASPPAVADAIALLVRFLEATDFGALRAAHPDLAGGTPCRVHLRWEGGGGIGWRRCDGPDAEEA